MADLGAGLDDCPATEVFVEAGFTRFRRATESPINLALQANP
jgi:hypothetical protein